MKRDVKQFTQKPVAQLVVVLYFFPQIVALLLNSRGSSQGLVVALSVSVVAFFSIFFFLKLKKWEDGYSRALASFLNQEQEEQKPANDAVCLELGALQEEKQKLLDEKITLQKKFEEMQRICDQQEVEKKRALQEVQQSLQKAEKSHTEVLQEKEEMLVALRADLLELTLQKKIYEEKIDALQTEIGNLKFEMKTILKVVATEK